MSDETSGGRSVNRAGLASVFAVSLPTIDAWVRKGCPVVERGGTGREWQFDTAAVIEWRTAKAVEDAVAGMGGDKSSVTKDQADTRRAIALAIKAEVEADEALKAVVYRQEVETDILAFCQALRIGLGNASAKIAGRATSMTNAAEIEDLCHGELNRSFEGAKTELAERWSSERSRDGDAAG